MTNLTMSVSGTYLYQDTLYWSQGRKQRKTGLWLTWLKISLVLSCRQATLKLFQLSSFIYLRGHIQIKRTPRQPGYMCFYQLIYLFYRCISVWTNFDMNQVLWRHVGFVRTFLPVLTTLEVIFEGEHSFLVSRLRFLFRLGWGLRLDV